MGLQAGQRWRSPDGAAEIVITSVGDGGAAFERVLRPRSGKAGAHRHMDYEERFEILEGEARAEVDGNDHLLAAGDALVVPHGAPHRNPYNITDVPMRYRQMAAPAPEFLWSYLATWGPALETGRATRQDELPLPAIMLVAGATDGQSFAAGIPIGLQKAVLAPILGAIGRARGYRAVVP